MYLLGIISSINSYWCYTYIFSMVKGKQMENIAELEAKYQELGKEIEKLKAEECEYPKFFKHKTDGYVVKFISLELGIMMTMYGDSRISSNYFWTAHTYTKIWEEVPYDKETGFYHKQLVWCWNNSSTHERVLRFYDAINKCVFNCWGVEDGTAFGNYEPYDWSCDFINKWAIEAVKTLKDK